VKKSEEIALVSRAALLGNRQAFGVLVEAYQLPVRRFLFHLCDDEELSKDLAQDVFLKAWLSIHSFRATAKFSTWLFRIAYNTFYDYMRQKKPCTELDSVEIYHQAENPQFEVSLDFARSMSMLGGDEKTAMLLFYMEDFTVAKIAQIMECPVGTVKSLLFRGKEKLSVYFKNSEYDK
jgi:RNA polymerase sigma-70 factor (ECF subfamily)